MGHLSMMVSTGRLLPKAVTAAKLNDSANESAWVGARTAALAAGAIGTYAMLGVTGTFAFGDTFAGSAVVAAGAGVEFGGNLIETMAGAALNYGTWRAMGYGGAAGGNIGLFLRIS